MNQATAEAPVAHAIPGAAALAADLGSNVDPEAAVAPLPPPGAAPTIDAQLAALQAQVQALLSLMPGVVQLAAARAVPDEALQVQAAAVEMPATPVDERRVRIILEDNDAIPPGGQFAQANGVPFLLQSGMEMDAPISLLDVLDHAITSVPVCDQDRNIIGYRDRLRFPYRVIRSRTEQ